MAKKKCGICGKELGFWSSRYPVKDGIICGDCIHTADFFNGVNQTRINKFLDTQTVAEIKELIDNPEKLEKVKQKVAPAKHYHLPPIAKCSFCGRDIYRGDAPLKFKNSEYLCRDCMAKYKFTISTVRAHTWASEHTIADFKEHYLDKGKDFADIYSEIEQQIQKEEAEKEKQRQIKQAEKEKQRQIKQAEKEKQRQKEEAEKEKQRQIKQAEKEKRKQEQAAIKAESVYYGGYYFDIDKRKIYANTAFHGIEFFVNADEITSYRVNEKGHDKNKHHVFTRATVGAIIAGPAGAVIAGTTGGKINEYIDELGVIINLTDGGNFEVSLLNSKNNKADGFLVKHAYSNLNHVIAILDSWKATEKVVEDTQDSTDAPAEIRKYKQLLDDGIITKEEFEAKKKQLLGL
ncbi:DUF4428 domain-containing protein [Lactobacillus bombicola]|uniref:SHOCT domain-containing protein n=1 Tax=Lactobacillus bombicola TaxID=1505723 RepID=A0A396SP88_9LACO|nr:DUF4428 domain-containing protein [Lactobacillus bombicola]RHW53177.1 hypothetical protein DS835_08000 [Lactobacillus bombicola]